MKKNAESYLIRLKEIDNNFISTEKTLEEITQKFYLSSFFNEIIENEIWISEIASKSYHHDNGFEKLTIFSGENFNLRFHIYWNNMKQIKPNVHDHRWNFSSKILNGAYISELYEIADNGIEKEIYRYYSNEKLEGKYSLYHEGKVLLKKIESTIYNKSDINHGKAGEIHSIIYTKIEPTITLFITSKYKNEYARVLTDNHIGSKEIKSETMTTNEIILKFNKISKIIFQNGENT